MMSSEIVIDLQKTKAIIFDHEMLTDLIYQKRAIEIIEMAAERDIPIFIHCSIPKFCSEIEKIKKQYNLNLTITHIFEFASDLKKHNLEMHDCFFIRIGANTTLSQTGSGIKQKTLLVTSENDLDMLSREIGRRTIKTRQSIISQQNDTSTAHKTEPTPRPTKRGVPLNYSNETQPQISTTMSITSIKDKDKNEKFKQDLNLKLAKRNNLVQQLGFFPEAKIQTSEKIQAIVCHHALLKSPLSQKKIIAIISQANEKNIPVFIYCEDEGAAGLAKLFTQMYSLKASITEKFDLADCLQITSDTRLDPLSAQINLQPKSILEPEKDFLAKNFAKVHGLGEQPQVRLENKHLLTITLKKENTELITRLRTYNFNLYTRTKQIQIESREQIERFVKDHGCEPAKLYEDAGLKYSPMPKIITTIVIEHDLLIQFSKHNEKGFVPTPCQHQNSIINLIKEALQKGIPVIVRCANDGFYGVLSTLLYTTGHPFSHEILPIMNQSELNAAFRKEEGPTRDDCLYVTIPNSTLYETDTSKRTHVLLIDSPEDMDYLSDKIKIHDADMLHLEKLRVAKDVRNTYSLSKTPDIELVTPELLHIMTANEADVMKLYPQCEKYGAKLYHTTKIVSIESSDDIARFIQDHKGNTSKFYKQAGRTYNSTSYTQQ